MDLNTAAEAGEPLAIQVAPDNVRPVAELFTRPGGIVWFDIGWPRASWHPVHIIAGEITGDGPWRVGTTAIYVPRDGDPRLREIRGWRAWRTTEEGKRFNRAAARQALRERGILD